ncbi:NADH-cytochrome b5 reductase [Saguinus oedipus]|uniref:Carbonyl reductase [NADPH] 1 n=1 Tax=Saguinus oedipus TaxID=9490 RepID=A0ABQ9U9N5_SAGOE|nr:NADH-cytochrome b5 reductase [Saguinus oedipus]
MWSCIQVALVTGGNKGIGLAIVRYLCRQFSGDVVLTARDVAQGQAAVQQLQAEGLSPGFHQLDIDEHPRPARLLAQRVADPTPFHIQAEVTMKTNFFGTRDVCTELLPLIKPHGRVVNVSSTVSLRALKSYSPELQQKFRSETITEEELVGLMNKFMEDTKKGVHQKAGWPNTAYGVTKIGVTVLSRIHARKLSEQRKGDKIFLNACCPGWVRIDMAGPNATKSLEEGAETPVYLAFSPPDAEGSHGQLFRRRKLNSGVNWNFSAKAPGLRGGPIRMGAGHVTPRLGWQQNSRETLIGMDGGSRDPAPPATSLGRERVPAGGHLNCHPLWLLPTIGPKSGSTHGSAWSTTPPGPPDPSAKSLCSTKP